MKNNKKIKVCVIGKYGFIGSSLTRKFESLGYEVTSTPSKDVIAIFDFGSPVHMPFEQAPDYYIQTLLPKHLYFLSLGIYYVWPSSALVYEDKSLAFINFKKSLEEISFAYPNNLGLRIFPIYGPGETRTAIYQWCRDMSMGKRPEVWGDGKQKRDFIYIDDVIDSIIKMAGIGTNKKRMTGIVDIGGGNPIAFNKIIKTINNLLNTDLQPIYKQIPKEYSKGIVCQNPVTAKTDIEDGCRAVLEWIKQKNNE